MRCPNGGLNPKVIPTTSVLFPVITLVRAPQEPRPPHPHLPLPIKQLLTPDLCGKEIDTKNRSIPLATAAASDPAVGAIVRSKVQ